MTDRLLERELRRLEAPDEGEAALRAWEMAAAEFERMEHAPAPRSRRPWLRPLVAGGAVVAVAAVAISPTGASVAHWVSARFSTPGVESGGSAILSIMPARLAYNRSSFPKEGACLAKESHSCGGRKRGRQLRAAHCR